MTETILNAPEEIGEDTLTTESEQGETAQAPDLIELEETIASLPAEPGVINAVIDDGGISEPQQAKELTQSEKLLNRRTGFFGVNVQLADLVWLKNSLASGKIKFVGPNEAFMVINSYLGISSAIARAEVEQTSKNPQTPIVVQLQASSIEGAAILLNKYESSGIDSAQRLFRLAVALNESIMEMKSLDQQIQMAREAEQGQPETH